MATEKIETFSITAEQHTRMLEMFEKADTQKARSGAYGKAAARLKAAHKNEFDKYHREELSAVGLEVK